MRRRRLLAPPSRAQWAIDAELHGHTVAQTLQYLSDCADWEDAQIVRYRHPDVITADVEPWLASWLRGRARRAARG